MATAVFYQRTGQLARVLSAAGFPPALHAGLGLRAFGLDLVIHADGLGEVYLVTRSVFRARSRVSCEYLLPLGDPVPQTRRIAASSAGARDPTCATIVRMMQARSRPLWADLAPGTMTPLDLLRVCTLDNLAPVAG